jgi:hypothetical protein
MPIYCPILRERAAHMPYKYLESFKTIFWETLSPGRKSTYCDRNFDWDGTHRHHTSHTKQERWPARPHKRTTAPKHAPQPLCAMRAEHLWNAERARARATASRAHPRPAGESHPLVALSTPICAMFLDSKMRPRIVLRQAEHRVSIERALYWRATSGPQRGRLERAEA